MIWVGLGWERIEQDDNEWMVEEGMNLMILLLYIYQDMPYYFQSAITIETIVLWTKIFIKIEIYQNMISSV